MQIEDLHLRQTSLILWRTTGRGRRPLLFLAAACLLRICGCCRDWWTEWCRTTTMPSCSARAMCTGAASQSPNMIADVLRQSQSQCQLQAAAQGGKSGHESGCAQLRLHGVDLCLVFLRLLSAAGGREGAPPSAAGCSKELSHAPASPRPLRH